MRHRIIFFTENTKKYEEVANFLASNTETYPNIILEYFKPLTAIPEIQSLDREEIVRAKLISIALVTQSYEVKPAEDTETVWIVAEDTSLTIEKLGGFPGPFVKFFLESMPLNRICEISTESAANNIVSVGAIKLLPSGFFRMDDISNFKYFEGVIKGVISSTPRGSNGFGFDPVFIPTDGENQTMKTNAEFTPAEKNNINPRTKAFAELFKWVVEASG